MFLTGVELKRLTGHSLQNASNDKRTPVCFKCGSDMFLKLLFSPISLAYNLGSNINFPTVIYESCF